MRRNVGRRVNGNGEPVGYTRLTGLALLNTEMQQKFLQLPQGQPFKFKIAMQVYGKSDNPTNEFSKKCIAAGVLQKDEARKEYERLV